jgi:hypothetical protein
MGWLGLGRAILLEWLWLVGRLSAHRDWCIDTCATPAYTRAKAVESTRREQSAVSRPSA